MSAPSLNCRLFLVLQAVLEGAPEAACAADVGRESHALASIQPAAYLFAESILRTSSTVRFDPRSSEAIIRVYGTRRRRSKA